MQSGTSFYQKGQPKGYLEMFLHALYAERSLSVGWKNLSCGAVHNFNLHICIKCISGSVQNLLSVHPHADIAAWFFNILFTSVLFNLWWVFLLNLCHPQKLYLLMPKEHAGVRQWLFLTVREQLELLTVLIFDWSFGRLLDSCQIDRREQIFLHIKFLMRFFCLKSES